MSAPFVVLALILGAASGYGGGALAVWLERVEHLEEEEDEERREHEASEADRIRVARDAGDSAAVAVPWSRERYGWTWLERVAAPVLGAVGWGAFVAHENWGIALPIHLLWVTLFVHIAVFDVKHRLILNRVSYPAIAVAIALAPLQPGLTLQTAVTGAVLVFLFFGAQSLALGGSIVGMGDAKLGAVLGATCGIGFDLDHLGAVYAVISAVMAAGVVAFGLLVTRVRGLRDPIPYGPFLCAGAALIIFHGPAGS